MPVTKEQVLQTASLVRLSLSNEKNPAEADAAITRIASQMNEVIAYMDILNQVDTTDIEPLYSPMQCVAPPREDEARQERTAEEILRNAPEKHGSFFVVPPVL